jgi:hypothetical protein
VARSLAPKNRMSHGKLCPVYRTIAMSGRAAQAHIIGNELKQGAPSLDFETGETTNPMRAKTSGSPP